MPINIISEANINVIEKMDTLFDNNIMIIKFIITTKKIALLMDIMIINLEDKEKIQFCP